MSSQRLLPLSGVAFVVLALVATIGVGETPTSTAPGEEVLAFHDDEAVRQGVAAFLLAASDPSS